ncbi:MAG: hypothetical protein K1X89_12100 [Myxococcaceae bacterium]|nr:hypothetical protein [Myxococcaceae bacterium]
MRLKLLAVLLAAAAGAPAAALAAPPPPSPRADDAAFSTNLALLNGVLGTPAASVDPARYPGATAAERWRAAVRERMKDDALYLSVLPRMFVYLNMRADGPPFELMSGKLKGREFYYLHEPCKADQLVSVDAWWRPGKPVQVCKDSYLPEIKSDDRAGSTQYCEATENRNPDPSICGCGEHLLNCAPQGELAEQIGTAYSLEAVKTMQHVIQSQKPFGQVLTGNETVRSNHADFYYARDTYFRGGPLAIPPQSDKSAEAFSLRSRPPQYEGGLLTSPLFRYGDEAPRVLVSVLWWDFLCTVPLSLRVHAEQIFELKNPKLRSGDHMELAAKTGCRDCHARIENALKAFKGFVSSRVGQRSVPLDGPPETMKFYVRDSLDMRAEGPATPTWLGATLVSQPEFAGCMTKKVQEIVYGGEPVPTEVTRAMVSAFKKDQNLQTLIEDAVVARFAGSAAVTAAPVPSGPGLEGSR